MIFPPWIVEATAKRFDREVARGLGRTVRRLGHAPELLADALDLATIEGHKRGRRMEHAGQTYCLHLSHRRLVEWPCDELLNASTRHVDRIARGVEWMP